MINTSQILTGGEIDNIVDNIDPQATTYRSVEKTIVANRVANGNWNFDKFWEDALSIFAEQFSKDEQ